MGYEEQKIEGRNAVLEAFRSGKTIDKLFVLDGCQDGPVRTIVREARKHDTIINFVDKERLDQLSETKKHQGVIAVAAAYEYAEVEDILKNAEEKGEPPFIFILDNIEDPHNLGAIIRTANLAGAHGVIIPKRRAVGLTATVAKTSAGAINYTPAAYALPILPTTCLLRACSTFRSYCRRCLTISYASTPAATDAFKESISPFIGMDAIKSQFSFTSLLTPSPSFPMTRPIGPFKSSFTSRFRPCQRRQTINLFLSAP